MSKKRKKKNILFCILIIIILVITGIVSYKHIFKDEEKNENAEINEKEKKELSPYEQKLKKLDNIDTKISFFKSENIDRYISYKEKNPSLDTEKVVVYVNIGLDNEFYTNRIDSPLKDTNFVIANKYYYLGEDYVPSDMVLVNSAYSSKDNYLKRDAASSFNDMAKKAKEEGLTIRAVSTYRSYDYQKGLYDRYAKADGVKNADTYSARAGYSEHQTALAVDVDNAKVSYTNFGNTKEFTWMQENAYKYGFILRYTKENEWITGYKDEPWHYRYVGVEISTYIHNNPMTYEEYFVRFLDKKN